jgi:D-threo-aldose 1-dehydrogenase
MDPFKRVEIGSTGLYVTRCGLGARGIVDPNVEVSDEQATATVETSLDLGINYIDTSPRYGLGRSEKFVGQVVAQKDRASFVLSTKVGRLLDPEVKGGWYWDFSGDGARRSLETSLERLKLDQVEILFIHSPTHHFEVAMAEAYPALAEMRSSGIVKAIGVGMTDSRKLLRFAQEGEFDCFLLAGRYTLLDQSAQEKFLPYCLEHNIGIVLGGAYNSGILASDLGPDSYYDYRIAPAAVLEKARQIRDVCARYNIPLKAAALQFVLAHPAVTTVIPGSSYPEHVHENLAMIQVDIPLDLWKDLKHEGLIDENAPVSSQ